MLINQAEVKVKETEANTEAEILRVENTYWAELCKSLERIEKNEDFKKVILEGYFKDKAINGVSLLATDHVRRNGFRPEVMEQLVAISHLEDYFITIKNLGANVEDIGEDDEETGGN